ncbi:site-specific integrase [Bradyrhizobium sp. AZCC 2289]|uniref:site-specific integrase n=1 Tax=Bradyrhizobium sp. AZCC 2289 TaxID=3117026 RepID=UPI002FEEFA58
MDNLEWVVEVVQAADLEQLGGILHHRLGLYVVDGVPGNERRLAERLAFEHQVRTYIARAQERGYLFARHFPGFASGWVDFVDQNKVAETEIAKNLGRRAYETGRADERATTTQAQSRDQPAILSNSPLLAPLDPVALIERIVQNEVARRLGPGPAPRVEPQHLLLPPTAGDAGSDTEAGSGDKLISVAAAEFLKPADRKRQRTTKGRSDAEPVIRFAVEFLTDPVFNNVTPGDWKRLDEALTDIPKTKGIPREKANTLYDRYKYAELHGWSKLTRITEKTIRSKYWGGLYKFIDWAIAEKIYLGPRPQFECVDPENMASLPRDAFEDEELLNLLRLPLFTGCRNRSHVWKPGDYFVQSAIYWGFLICIFTGMRPGEVGQLQCSQIRTDGTFYYFDLRDFDARDGRVALKDLRSLKTNAAGRVVPIHPILIELGLLDRMQDHLDQGERLFPEWEKYTRKDGTVRWSQPLSKSWQYVKKILKIERADVSLYSTRHFFADLLDNEAIAQRTRDRILGHAGDVSRRYGRKGILDPAVAALIEALEPPVIKMAREILLGAKAKADRGELTVLKTYSTDRQG